jgi:N-formylmaleamate deformylase
MAGLVQLLDRLPQTGRAEKTADDFGSCRPPGHRAIIALSHRSFNRKGATPVSDEQAREVYERARLGQTFRRGSRPAVLVVDFSCGFTDPESTLGSDLSAEVRTTRELLDAGRRKGLPVVFTTIGYEPSGKDGGLWLEKVPALGELELGGRWVEIDPRLGRREDEPIIVKKGASAFFGTNLASILIAQGVDTVVLCGATTSGCVRASAIDLLQYGFPTLVPRECVGDRARGPHEANLFDIQAKYADVVPVAEALDYLESVPETVAAPVT